MISLGYAYSISTKTAFTDIFTKIYTDPILKSSIQKGLQSNMLQACGATEHIMKTISTLPSLEHAHSAQVR